MKICYVNKRFTASSLVLIDQANEIIEEYQDAGYDLTLRQLFYQFVSRDLIANTVRSYKRLGSVLNDGRLAGEIDWDAMVDRTRNLQTHSHWADPSEIIDSAARSYAVDLWANQQYRPEIWIEKDALLGVIEGVCIKNMVPFFSCRGYCSQSEMWRAARRFRLYNDHGQTPVIIHLGDMDPSGADMSRDIFDRIEGVFGVDIEFERIALNMPQVRQYNPPPNPAKLTDSRATKYIKEHGDESWELDALEPQVMGDLIQKKLDGLIDKDQWDIDAERGERERADLISVAAAWPEVVKKFGLTSE